MCLSTRVMNYLVDRSWHGPITVFIKRISHDRHDLLQEAHDGDVQDRDYIPAMVGVDSSLQATQSKSVGWVWSSVQYEPSAISQWLYHDDWQHINILLSISTSVTTNNPPRRLGTTLPLLSPTRAFVQRKITWRCKLIRTTIKCVLSGQ